VAEVCAGANRCGVPVFSISLFDELALFSVWVYASRKDHVAVGDADASVSSVPLCLQRLAVSNLDTAYVRDQIAHLIQISYWINSEASFNRPWSVLLTKLQRLRVNMISSSRWI
jgi:hypothetical protein